MFDPNKGKRERNSTHDRSILSLVKKEMESEDINKENKDTNQEEVSEEEN